MNAKFFPLVVLVTIVALVLAGCLPASSAEVGQLREEIADLKTALQQREPQQPLVVVLPGPAAPAAGLAAAESNTGQTVAEPDCRADGDYQLQDLPEVATAGSFLHVEFWEEGTPEMETILPTGRYILSRPLKGHVWEYSTSCTRAEVRAQVEAHIERRLADQANNAGWADMELVEALFVPVQ